jgi:hypothetical protein
MLLELSIMLLELSIILLELSIMLLENTYSTGVTHDDINMVIVQALGGTFPASLVQNLDFFKIQRTTV